jgi:hypothetical protein
MWMLWNNLNISVFDVGAILNSCLTSAMALCCVLWFDPWDMLLAFWGSNQNSREHTLMTYYYIPTKKCMIRTKICGYFTGAGATPVLLWPQPPQTTLWFVAWEVPTILGNISTTWPQRAMIAMVRTNPYSHPQLFSLIIVCHWYVNHLELTHILNHHSTTPTLWFAPRW